MTIVLKLPNLSELTEFEAKMILAGELYEREKLTSGQAAEMVGISKRAFIETIGNFGYSIFGNNEEDILIDVQNA